VLDAVSQVRSLAHFGDELLVYRLARVNMTIGIVLDPQTLGNQNFIGSILPVSGFGV
jgi:hypothetical protein